MENVEDFKRKCDSYIKRYYEGGVILTPFLDEASGAILTELCDKQGAIYYKSGKIVDSDRARFILSLYDVNPDDFKINIYNIKYNKKYYEINHRSILGSLMALGIKRECIGDIVLDDDKNAYFALTDEISKYVEGELIFIGKAPVELIKTNDEVKSIIRYEEKTDFVASMRLDVLVSAMANVSRNKALEILACGDVTLNYVLNQNPSHIVKDDDIISIRHYGKFKVKTTGGTSRSGRIAVSILRRV